MEPVHIFYTVYGFNLIVFFWELYLSFRQYRLYRDNVKRPDHVKEIIGDSEYTKARDYKMTKMRFGVFEGCVGKVMSSVILFTNFMPFLWKYSGEIVNTAYGESEILQSATFCFLTSVVDMITNTPFQLYETFVIEEKFGFNKQTLSFYFSDKAKKFVVSQIITFPVVAAVVWIVKSGGDYFFFYAWIFVSAIIFTMMTIYPEFIAPLFDKFTPLPESPLKEKIENLATTVEFPLSKLYVVEGSKRSSHSNAYMYGFWKNKRIVLYDTLLSEEMNKKLKQAANNEQDTESSKSLGMEDDEVVAVLGHELGHWKLSHTLCNLIIAEVNLLLVLIVFSYFYQHRNMYVAFGYEEPAVIVGMVLVFQYVMSPYNEVISVAMSALSRTMEFSADRFSAKLGYTPLLCSALIKLGKDNLSMPIDDPLYSMVHHSHPPIVERIDALKKFQ